MRKILFECDQCKKELGHKTHIHVDNRAGNRFGIALENKKLGAWEIKEKLRTDVLHFCNGICIGRYFSSMMSKRS